MHGTAKSARPGHHPMVSRTTVLFYEKASRPISLYPAVMARGEVHFLIDSIVERLLVESTEIDKIEYVVD